jgi:hypothetical protein
VDAREAWAKQSGLTTAQVSNAYAQAATSLGARVAAAPPTAPSTQWNLGQLQSIIQDYGANLDQRVLDSMYLGINASFHDSADSVLKTSVSDAYGSVFGPEAIDAHVRGVNQRAAASFITRTGKDGIKLSDRVWQANQQWRMAVQNVVQDAVISGQPPVQVARQIEQYLQPGVNVPYKAETAKRLKVPKDTSMPAMRVARTEMQNAFHEGTISSHSSMPSYLGIRWHIAAGLGHVPDICDEYAAHGFFPKGTEPSKPHPHCFCTAVPVHRDADDVLNDLEEWLHDPSSHPDLENYYQQLKPLLDVEVASVAGGAGGPLLGGYAKGEKVLIDVKGSEVIATVVGEHASKGVLTLTIDPGQGMASIKVWRAPSKVKLYTGPPTEPTPLQPGPPQTLLTGIDVGVIVHATKGQHLGKVGEVTALNTAGGLVHVKWTDGTENNVVLSNLEVAPPPPTNLAVGTVVKFHAPEQPQVDGQFGTIKAVHPNGDLEVQVNISGQSFIADVPYVGSFKLEAVTPTAAATTPGGPQVIGYVDMPGNQHHGKAVINQMDANSIAFKEGGWAFNADPWKLSPTDPTAVPPPPPAPPVAPPTSPFKVGDTVQIDTPQYPMTHGQQGTVTAISPTGIHQVQLADGSHEYFSTNEIGQGWIKPLATPPSASVGPQVPTVQGIDHLSIHDKVKVNDPGGVLNGATVELYGPPTLFGATEHIPVILPDGSVGYVQKDHLVDPNVPLGTATVGRPLATLDDLAIGDPVYITQGVNQGLTFYLGETPAWFNAADVLTVYATKDDLAKDESALFVGKNAMQPVTGFMVHEHPPLHQLKAGDTVLLLKSQWKGQEATLLEDMAGKKTGSLVPVQLKSGQHADFYPEEIALPASAATPPAGTTTGKPIEDYGVGDTMVVTNPNHPLFGQEVTLQAKWNANPNVNLTTSVPGGGLQFIKAGDLGIPPPPPSAPPVPVANHWDAMKAGDHVQINLPGSTHHHEDAWLVDDLAGKSATDLIAVHFADGSLYSYEVGQIAAPIGAPQPVPAGILIKASPSKGTQAVVYDPGNPDHGTKVEILQDKPGASDTTPIQVKFLEGAYAGDTEFYLHKQLMVPGVPLAATPAVPPPAVVTPPPGAAAVDVTQKGTKVVTDYKGQRNIYGTVTSFNTGKNVVVIKPDTPIPGMSGTTFTKNPKYVKAVVQPGTTPPVQPTTTPPPPPTPGSINHLKAGDTVIVNMPGSPFHGEEFLLEYDAAGLPPNAFVAATSVKTGALTTFTVSDLVPPGTPIAAPPPTLHTAEAGGKATYAGLTEVTLISPSSASSWKVELPDGSEVSVPTSVLTDFKPAPPGYTPPAAAPVAPPPPPTPPPTPPAPVPVDVTKVGTKVMTDYQGILVQGTVTAYNVGKKVVTVKPDTPIPGVPGKFQKSPSKVQPQAAPPGVTPAPAPLQPTVATPPAAGKPQMPTSLPPDPPQPLISSFKVTPQSVGGGHAKTIYKNPADDSTWMFKPDPNAANAEKAGYNVMGLLGYQTPEMHVMTVGGQVGSVQKFHDIKGTVKMGTLTSLTVAQRAEIQQHMIIDWLISQHDSNNGALLIGQDDHVLAIDKGQAFKFLGKDKLHWTYEPNPDGVVYRPLFEGYISHKYDLDRAAVDPLIDKIEALDDNVFKEAVRPYAEHAARVGLVASPDVIYDQLLKRKHSIRADVAKLYDEADALAGKPPRQATVSPTPQVAPVTTTVTTGQVTPIARPLLDAIDAAGWAGHSIMLGGQDVETGNALAYTLRKPDGSRQLVVEMRLRAQAEPKLLAKLDGVTHIAAAGAPVDPTWNTLLPAVKHVGYHLKPGSTGKDDTLTASKIQPILDIAQQIQGGNMDRGKADHYGIVISTLTGWSPAEVASQPLSALESQIKLWWSTNTAVHAATFDQYTPPTPSSITTTPPDKVKAKTEQPWGLQRALSPTGELTTTNARAVGRAAGHEGNALHTLTLAPDMTGTYMPFNQGGNMFSKQGRLVIYKDNYQGTEAEVQAALDQVKRLGVDAEVATADDMELLYLHHQAHAAKVEESADYKTNVLNKITPTMSAADQARIHRDWWNKRLGVSDVRTLPSYNPTPQFDATYRPAPVGHQQQEGGYAYFERFDISQADLDAALPGYGLTHRSSLGAEGFVDVLLDGNAHMAPTEERIRTGVYRSGVGMSSSADMGTGGANYFFTRISKPTSFDRGQFVFDTSLLRRTDLISYDGDRFGRADKNTKRDRNVTLADWKAASSGGSNEAIIKNGFPLLGYLKQIRAKTSAERNRIIAKFKARGISEVRGVPIEQVVIVGA